MAGLFSLMDVILQLPIGTILSLVALPKGVREALLGSPGWRQLVLQLATTYEEANWGACAETAARLGLTEPEVARVYYDAAAWAGQIVSTRSSPVRDTSAPDGDMECAIEERSATLGSAIRPVYA